MLRIKYFIESIIGLFLLFFRVFPLKKRILFSSFSGRQYSDSPKSISDYICENYPDVKIVWAFINPDKVDIQNKKIKKVKYKSLRYIYYVLTSKVYVDNVEIWSILKFRKGQTVVQTWHGGGAYKRVGTDRLDVPKLHKEHSVKKMNRMDIFLSSSKTFTEKVIRGAFSFKGEVLEAGLPRNDYLKSASKKEISAIKNELGINTEKKIVIYAPTFRNSLDLTPYRLDINGVTRALKEKFGGDWVVLLRLHYYMSDKLFKSDGQNTIDVTTYPDMQKLLMASDVLITDYSSSMWDFSLMYKPCFLYATDMKQYCGERDFYTKPESWPFAVGRDNNEVLENIKNFDLEEYVKKVGAHHKNLGSCESGNATKIICERIIDKLR